MKYLSATVIALAASTSICTAQADDKLNAAMKRIAELEAKNQALELSNKQKDALLKKQGIKISTRVNKTSAQSTLPPSTPLLSSSPVVTRSDDNAPSALSGAYFGVNGGYGGGDITSYTHLATQNGIFGTAYSVGRLGGAIAGGQI